jgi:hypothetical protein
MSEITEVIVEKKSVLGTFKANFDDRCIIGDCKGWSTEGEYFTITEPTGDIILDLKVDVLSPNHLEEKINKASFFISNATVENPTVYGKKIQVETELFGCRWLKKE